MLITLKVELQPFISICLLDISLRMSNNLLKLNIFLTELLIFLLKPVLSLVSTFKIKIRETYFPLKVAKQSDMIESQDTNRQVIVC